VLLKRDAKLALTVRSVARDAAKELETTTAHKELQTHIDGEHDL